ncbi:LacI family DNA-binding transcriptional regulator [Peptostreptococcus equinus]|uniref:LacI family DNA-binding transcriptional regulator n=1 Tax=Peptostreptococcus equinus TaxID=3003601 RepID=A0ABY7JSJ1_9FIRM|nr:LacI family DNA-binding transcriptional regulator [Peptostreptococcus sp. CBA3647]WAW14955.1 LacI family DNA-binding transcriptional regulator [Peptostreptococcus sp. CBA3647]
MATIKDVAKLAGVSVATVSRYINSNGYVSIESKEKIAKSIKELNYTPNEVARSLYKKTSKMVALIIPQIDNPYFTDLAKGVEDILKKEGYHLIISHLSEKDQVEKYVESFAMNNIAGIISAIESEKFSDISCPVVGVDRSRDVFEYAVYFDDLEGGKISANALKNTNARNVLINAGPKNIDVAKYRLQGMIEVLESNNISYDIYYSDTYDFESTQGLVDYLEGNIYKYDTIIACNDISSLTLAIYLQSRGIKIPEDIQIIGYDNTVFSKFFIPKLASINHDGKELGLLAAKMLIKLIKKENVEVKKIELRPYLVENNSLRK